MISKRFITSLLLSAAIMCAASYLWHGVLLSDFARLNRSKTKLLFLSLAISLIIAFVMIKLFEFEIMEKYFKRNPLLRGLIVGAVCGILFYFISKLIGFSYDSSNNIKHSLVDLVWQVFEQSLGGIVIGMVFIALYDPDVED